MSLCVDVEGIYPAAYRVFMCRLYNHACVIHGLPSPPSLLRYSLLLSYLFVFFFLKKTFTSKGYNRHMRCM